MTLTPDQAQAVAHGQAVSMRRIAEARLLGQFDALYEAGGEAECLRIVALLLERLRDRLSRDHGVTP